MAIKKISANLLGSNAVHTANIAGGAVSAADIADNSITAAKLSASTSPTFGGLTVDTSTLVVDATNNRVGIGTSTPSHLLHLESNVPTIKFTESDTSTNAFIQNTGGNLRLYADDGNTRADSVIGFHIDASERVKIDADGNLQILSGAMLRAYRGGNSAYAGLFMDTGENLYIRNSWATKDIVMVRTGEVGLGTSTPTSYYSGADNLVISQASGEAGISVVTANDTSGALYFADGTSGDAQYRGGLAYNHSTELLSLVSGGATKVVIDDIGRVGVGADTSPEAYISMISPHWNTGTEDTSSIRFKNSNNTADSIIQSFYDNSTNPILIGVNSYVASGGGIGRFSTDYASSYIYSTYAGTINIGTGDSSANATAKLTINNVTASHTQTPTIYTQTDSDIESMHYISFIGDTGTGTKNASLQKIIKESAFGSYNVNFDVGTYSNGLTYVTVGKKASTTNSYVKFKVSLSKCQELALGHKCSNSADGTTRTMNIDFSFDDSTYTQLDTHSFAAGTGDRSATIDFGTTTGTSQVSSGNYFTGTMYVRYEFKGGSSSHETLIGWNNFTMEAKALDASLVKDGGPGYGPIETAMFTLTSSSASTLVTNNGGFMTLAKHSNGGYMNPEIFEVDTSGNAGIHIKRDGKVLVTMAQDFITSDTSGYFASRIYRAPANDANNRVMSYQLTPHATTSGTWSTIQNHASFDVNAGDRVQFYVVGGTVTNMDAGNWSQYIITWIDSQHSGSDNRAVATYQENAHYDF